MGDMHEASSRLCNGWGEVWEAIRVAGHKQGYGQELLEPWGIAIADATLSGGLCEEGIAQEDAALYQTRWITEVRLAGARPEEKEEKQAGEGEEARRIHSSFGNTCIAPYK